MRAFERGAGDVFVVCPVASIRAWRFVPLPEMRTVRLYFGLVVVVVVVMLLEFVSACCVGVGSDIVGYGSNSLRLDVCVSK